MRYGNHLRKRSPAGNSPSFHANILPRTENSTAWNPIAIVMHASSRVCTSNVIAPTTRGPGSNQTVAAAPSAIRTSPGYRKSQRGL